ncbi:hypothetical protein LK07_15425 [Streptomyces pluripotens]|uniref:Integral membrane protein n=1 Tax=Streptomyces pluripotens TaxID=1355015 RepID=A0A221NYT2_9ACTN|nr:MULTISPECIES: hypothetical protein [Streptomyces]ARP70928.1 hypothetical protein LK06_014280 [Streptomyces pluripotens]ASN25183.1 hypothetical protein LK07_15425 [Streptomyces pluripotens]KIE27634.1 hypothetical protein LK08_06960 [Streptomyces sp. MUSC 125]
MTVGWCARTVRAAVFAAVCVLLAALGHTMMSGAEVPWWALAAGIAATGGTAWWLAGRERGPLLVVSVAVTAQTGLHASFSLAQALVVHPAPLGGRSLAQQWLDHLLCRSSSGPGTAQGAPTMFVGPMGPMGHGIGGASSTGMLAAHLLAAVLSGLWLACGERAAFRILRALAGWLVAPLRLLLRLPVPPHRPRLRVHRAGSGRVPHRLFLAYAITSRGPPAAGTAAV